MLGYHPLLATRADTGEVLHARMRKGSANTQRGAGRFIDELIARVRRAGATGELTVRVDSGFWSNDTIAALNRLNVRYTMAVRCGTKGIADAIAAIPDETAWADIDYTPDGQAQVADCAYTTGTGDAAVTRRLVVRRTRLTGTAQQRLWPDWRHHAFLTDLDGTAVDVDKFHRHHAVVELAIRDLKEGAGLEHVPSGNFHANTVWLQCAVLAHNLIRWTAILGNVRVDDQLIVARTIRTRLLAIPGRLVNRAGRPTLRLPTHWPWANAVHHRARHSSAPYNPPPADTATAVRRAAHTPPALTTATARRPASTRPNSTQHRLGYAEPTGNRSDPRSHGPIGGSRVMAPGGSWRNLGWYRVSSQRSATKGSPQPSAVSLLPIEPHDVLDGVGEVAGAWVAVRGGGAVSLDPPTAVG